MQTAQDRSTSTEMARLKLEQSLDEVNFRTSWTTILPGPCFFKCSNLKVEECLEQEKRSKQEVEKTRRKLQGELKLLQELLADKDR